MEAGMGLMDKWRNSCNSALSPAPLPVAAFHALDGNGEGRLGVKSWTAGSRRAEAWKGSRRSACTRPSSWGVKGCGCIGGEFGGDEEGDDFGESGEEGGEGETVNEAENSISASGGVS